MRATVIWTGEPLECNDQPEKVPWQGLDSLPASVAEDAAGLTAPEEIAAAVATLSAMAAQLA